MSKDKSSIVKFTVEVIRTDEYEIEIDTQIYNDEWLRKFRRNFFDFHSTEDVAKYLAQWQARHGATNSNRFIEGFGHVLRDGELPFSTEDYKRNGNRKPESELAKPSPGLNIRIIDEDDTIEVNAKLLTNK